MSTRSPASISLAEGQFAVEDINLQVNEGEFIAIVGPPGCGKSTFMKLASGLLRPSKGTVVIGGQPVTGPLKITGMVFQAPSLLPWRSTVQNVMLPLEIVEPCRSSFKQNKARYEDKARTLLQSVGLDGYKASFRGSCRAACSNAPASAARWCPSPSCCCSTNPLARWTLSPAKSCGARCATWS